MSVSLVPPAPPPMPGAQQGNTVVNQRLSDLATSLYATDPVAAQAIMAYIQSGWTTPVPVSVQAQVSQIVGRPVPAAPPANGPEGGVTENFGTPPAPTPGTAGPGSFAASPGAPSYATAPPTLPSGGTPVPDPGFDLTSFWGGGNPPAAQGGPQATPGGNPFAGVVDEFGHPAGENYGNTVATNQAKNAVANAANNAVAAGTKNAQQQSQAGTTTVPSKTTVAAGSSPAGGAGTVDPNSAVGQGGYAAAMGGDQTALNAVLGTVLKQLGVDVTRPGLYTGSLVDEIQPYLQTYLRYFGLDNGKPALDRAREAAGSFGNMLGSAGTFGQLQDYGRSLVGKTGMLDDLFNRDSTTPQRQMGMANDLLGLLSAGNNQVLQSSDRAEMLAGQQRYAQQALDQPGLKYNDYLKSQPQAALGLLAQLLGG
jgi:hypothetical protein